MPRQQAVKAKLQDRFDELKTLRDNIRVDLQLASMELRDEWKSLESKLIDPATAAEQLRDLTSEAIERLVAELRGFRTRLREGSEPTVGRTMSRAPVTCAPGDSLAQAVTAMWNHDLGWLPVVAADGRVVGVITDRDAAIAACTRGQRMDEIQVDTVMSTDVAACPPETSLQDALALLRSRRLRRLAVVGADGRQAGVVTINDLTRAMVDRLDVSARPEGAAAIVHSLATIAQPRPTASGSSAN
jgi:CBS domain-containing protein